MINVLTYDLLIDQILNLWRHSLLDNLGQIKWNIETTPPPKISDGKMARFGLHTPSSLIWGRGGISVPFYSVQDCRDFNYEFLEHDFKKPTPFQSRERRCQVTTLYLGPSLSAEKN